MNVAITSSRLAMFCTHTSLLSVDVDLDVRLLERAPFEILLVTTTFHISSCTLLTPRLLFTTFQSFRFTRHASCSQTPSVCLSPSEVKLLLVGHVDTITALALLRFDDTAVATTVHCGSRLSRRLLLRFRRTLTADMLGGAGLLGSGTRWWAGS